MHTSSRIINVTAQSHWSDVSGVVDACCARYRLATCSPQRCFVSVSGRSNGGTRHGRGTCASFGGGNRLEDDMVYEAERSDETGKKLAVLLGAARVAKMSPPVFKAKLAELQVLLPSISADRLLQLDRNLLAQLASDTPGVATRLVRLTVLFPTANVPRLVAKRPALVLEREFEQVPAARAALAQMFPDSDIDYMVEQQPLLLVENIGEAIETLRRLMPQTDPLQTLRHNPHMLVSVMSNRKLSLW